MAAVAHLSPPRERRLVVVRSAPATRSGPARASTPGRTAAAFRRRRVVAAALAAVLLGAVVLALSLAVQSFVGADQAAPPVSAGPAASQPVHIVQPGDTFWDIARAFRPNDDPRPLVARMVAAHGGPVLRVGERIPRP